MQEARKGFRRNMAVLLLVFFVLYFVVTIGYDMIMGNSLTGCISSPAIRDRNIQTVDDLDYSVFADREDILEVQNLWFEDGKIYYTVKGNTPGDAFLLISKAGETVGFTSEYFVVTRGGMVTCPYTGNYPNSDFHLLANVLFLTLFAIVCLIGLLRYHKRVLYSYDSMFLGGMLIWLTCTIIIQWHAYLTYDFVLEYYICLQHSAFEFMLYTAPIVWVFCISLTISNVSLIRHEGFRPVNALGIVISILLIFGSLGGFAVYYAAEFHIRAFNILFSSYCSAYSLFACLWEGAILGGIDAAKHIPPMDCDYIIILGCMIKKGGVLTPLLRSRVDRAIAHGRAQEQATGKKVIYVPSGGQGDNEDMSEGEAMKRYLLTQGIPESQILVEGKSKNTYENMKFSRDLITAQKPDAKIAFSTTNYHVFRSGIIAAQQNFQTEGMGSPTKWYFWPNAFIREFLGIVVYTKYSIATILASLVAVFAVIDILLLAQYYA